MRKKCRVAAVPLTHAANTSVRSTTSRRVFPPLQFVSEGVRSARKSYNTRSSVTKNMPSSDAVNHNGLTCFKSRRDDNVADGDVCSEYVEQEVQTETAENLPLTRRHTMTDSLAKVGTSNMNSSDHEQTRCIPNPVHSEPACCGVVDKPDSRDQLTDIISMGVHDKNLPAAEKSPSCVELGYYDLTAYAENVSAVHFYVNTPTHDVEPLDCSEAANKVGNESAACPSACVIVECPSAEPVHILSFSRVDGSLDETVVHTADDVICAAVLKENVSELVDGDEEMPGTASDVVCHRFFYTERPEFFSTPDSSTPFKSHRQDTVLVTDTPVSEYGLSYRQRALRAANIRLRHRTRKS